MTMTDSDPSSQHRKRRLESTDGSSDAEAERSKRSRPTDGEAKGNPENPNSVKEERRQSVSSSTGDIDVNQADVATNGRSKSSKDDQDPEEMIKVEQIDNGQSNSRNDGRISNDHQHGSQSHGMAALTLRALVSSKDAGIIIGKGGRNVQEIREQSGARVQISEQLQGVTERVLTVQGPVDVVAKAFALVGRRMIEEQHANSSNASDSPINLEHRPVSIRLLIPHGKMGSIIGKGGGKIKDIQELSNARLTASEEMMPGSTERCITITGVPDAIHIATFHVGRVLVDRMEKQNHHNHHHHHHNQNTILYRPQGRGNSGTNASAAAQAQAAAAAQAMSTVTAAYGNAPNVAFNAAAHAAIYAQQVNATGQTNGSSRTSGALSPNQDWSANAMNPSAQMAAAAAAAYYGSSTATAGMVTSGSPHYQHGGHHNQQTQQQQMFVPNKMVGAIIGKGGVKINEIRNMSGSQIRIADNVGPTGERLVTITGTPESIQVALYLLYAKLESEKSRLAAQGVSTADWYVTPATQTTLGSGSHYAPQSNISTDHHPQGHSAQPHPEYATSYM